MILSVNQQSLSETERAGCAPSMSQQQIRARELRDQIVPKLKVVETVVQTLINDRMMQYKQGHERKRFEALKSEFELEVMMIRMNLKHLMKREALLLERTWNGDDAAAETLLALDELEANAIERLQTLYRRAQALNA